jgi:hypothetical protein
MASFQIVYDDFSGGQYMGPRDTNLPKNTYFASNVATTPHGRLMPMGILEAVDYTLSGSPSAGYIKDFWQVGNEAYAFVNWVVSSTNTPRMVKFSVNDGTSFPQSGVVTSLTGRISGKVAYDPANTKFFYVDAGNIRTVTTTGTTATASTALSATGVTDIALYGYRMVTWGGNGKRLYYSDTDLTTYSTSNYYEFNGPIINVLPRANDLLVFCTTGVFSVVGVLGSSVTIQLIVPQDNVTEGMKDAVIVGRSAFFLDQKYDGSIDGRIYQLVGSNVQPVFTMDIEDVRTSLMQNTSPARIQITNNGMLTVQFYHGTCYAMTSPGVWTRYDGTISSDVDPTEQEQYLIARPGPSAQNEYFLAAYLDVNDGLSFKCRRVIRSVAEPTYSDENFVYTGTASVADIQPQGTATLAEYWHQKPFSVKQALVQWGSLGTKSQVGIEVLQTGLLDATPTVGANNMSSFIALATSDSLQRDILNRTYPNDANKGYGVKVILDLNYATVKRVILICED